MYTEVFLLRIFTRYSRIGTRAFEIPVQDIVTRVGEAVMTTELILSGIMAVYVERTLLTGPFP